MLKISDDESDFDYIGISALLAEQSKALGRLATPKHWQYLLILYQSEKKYEKEENWKGLAIQDIADEMGITKNITNVYRDLNKLQENLWVIKDWFIAGRADTGVFRISSLGKQVIEDFLSSTESPRIKLVKSTIPISQIQYFAGNQDTLILLSSTLAGIQNIELDRDLDFYTLSRRVGTNPRFLFKNI